MLGTGGRKCGWNTYAAEEVFLEVEVADAWANCLNYLEDLRGFS